MADGEKPSDKAGAAQRAPLKDPKIDVEVKPRQSNMPKKGDPKREMVERHNDGNKKAAEKLKEDLARNVKDAVKKAGDEAVQRGSPNPRKDQLDAAKKAGDDVAKKVSPNTIKEISVSVDGNTTTHPPSEGKPPGGQ